MLRRGLPGTPDSLQIVFSEPVRLANAGAHPFLSLRVPEGTAYRLDLSQGSLSRANALRDGETAYLFTVLAAMGDSPALAVVPKAGDSLWIDPAAGIADSLGNVQANPSNARVPLQVWVPLVYSVAGAAPKGFASIPATPQGAPWTVYAGPATQGSIGLAPASLPTIPQMPDPSRSGGLVLETTYPFLIDLRVFNNLGQFVTRVRLNVTDKDFTRLEAGSTLGSRRLHLLWNGIADNGNLAATGAYVHAWNITFFPVDGKPQSTEGKRIFLTKILRSP